MNLSSKVDDPTSDICHGDESGGPGVDPLRLERLPQVPAVEQRVLAIAHLAEARREDLISTEPEVTRALLALVRRGFLKPA